MSIRKTPLGALPGVVEPGRLYLCSEVRSRLRLGDHAFRSMRRAGLRVIYSGNQAYLLGDDVIAYFRNLQSQNQKES